MIQSNAATYGVRVEDTVISNYIEVDLRGFRVEFVTSFDHAVFPSNEHLDLRKRF